jgi:hypothetical protein
MKRSITPKRKRLKRTQRISASKEWIKKYTGKNIVKGYAKWYGVDLICAIGELRIVGLNIPLDYEQKVKKTIEANRIKRLANSQKRNKQTKDLEDDYLIGDFEFIAGFTSGGFPFGIRIGEIKDSDDLE